MKGIYTNDNNCFRDGIGIHDRFKFCCPLWLASSSLVGSTKQIINMKKLLMYVVIMLLTTGCYTYEMLQRQIPIEYKGNLVAVERDTDEIFSILDTFRSESGFEYYLMVNVSNKFDTFEYLVPENKFKSIFMVIRD